MDSFGIPRIYTIIGGVNGTGKSSLTGALRAERQDLGQVIDADKLSAAHGGPIAGGKAAIRKVESCLCQGLSFTQETTLSGVRILHTVQRAREAGYFIRLYYIGLDSVEDSLQRIANRVAKGGHTIPTEDVQRRFASRFEDLARVLPYCDEAIFFDNNNGFVQVAEYKNGELLCMGEYRPRWVEELRLLL